jgi:two-component system, OmpR family, KDP operon response regulator KdpE
LNRNPDLSFIALQLQLKYQSNASLTGKIMEVMMNGIKVLVVDDDPQICRLLRIGLKGYGYHVVTIGDSEEALTLAAQQMPEVIILDINLGSQTDGIELCHRLREWCKASIIMLSVNDDKKAKLSAFGAGADDYVVKPFDMEELAARIEAVLRRSAVAEDNASPAQIQAKDLVVDLVKRRVVLKGEEIHLTPKEYDLLRLLATHPGQVLTTHTLLDEVWGPNKRRAPHLVNVHVNTLRKKLGESPTGTTHYIFTEPGIGYRFVDV